MRGKLIANFRFSVSRLPGSSVAGQNPRLLVPTQSVGTSGPVFFRIGSAFVEDGAQQVVHGGEVVGQHHLVSVGKNLAHLSASKSLALR